MRRSYFVLLTVVFAGCGSGDQLGPARPSVVPMKGVALFANGEPLSKVRITLHPDKSMSPQIEVVGDTDATGHFTLTTYLRNDGAVPGSYTFTVEPFDYNNPSPVKNAAMEAKIPKKYSEPSTSDLKVEITSDKSEIQIKLNP